MSPTGYSKTEVNIDDYEEIKQDQGQLSDGRFYSVFKGRPVACLFDTKQDYICNFVDYYLSINNVRRDKFIQDIVRAHGAIPLDNLKDFPKLNAVQCTSDELKNAVSVGLSDKVNILWLNGIDCILPTDQKCMDIMNHFISMPAAAAVVQAAEIGVGNVDATVGQVTVNNSVVGMVPPPVAGVVSPPPYQASVAAPNTDFQNNMVANQPIQHTYFIQQNSYPPFNYCPNMYPSPQLLTMQPNNIIRAPPNPAQYNINPQQAALMANQFAIPMQNPPFIISYLPQQQQQPGPSNIHHAVSQQQAQQHNMPAPNMDMASSSGINNNNFSPNNTNNGTGANLSNSNFQEQQNQ